tara:strand:+ start:1008 stop:1430 length:423 start_codon:yes stop_codon:yes gene_type:complete
MSDKSPSDDDVQNKVTNEFKKKVLKWLDIDDEIRAMAAKKKELEKEKKQYQEFILSFLENVGEKEIATRDGKLRRNISKTKGPLNKAHIQKAIDEVIKDKTKSNVITEHIINSRPMVDRVNLKRTKNRGPKKPKEPEHEV